MGEDDSLYEKRIFSEQTLAKKIEEIDTDLMLLGMFDEAISKRVEGIEKKIAIMQGKELEFQERIEAVEKKLEQHTIDEYAHRR